MDLLAGQRSWSAGIVRGVARHLIPADGAYDIRDGLLDDDGMVYQRGGSTRATANPLNFSINALWEAQFSAGRRMLGLSATSVGVINAAGTDWDVLVAGSGGVAGGALAAQIGEIMFVPYVSGGARALGIYAGSRKAGPYVTGTMTVTLGSVTVTGVGTAWLANADAGMLVHGPGGSYVGVVKSVDTNTQLTLCDPWQGPTTAGGGYSLGTFSTLNTAPPVGPCVAAVGGRLLYAQGRKVYMSRTIDPSTGQSRLFGYGGYVDYHEFPADIVALATLRDRVYVFHKAGIAVISGAALEIVDAFGNAQHQVEKVSGEVVLRSPGALCTWRDSLVIGAVDGVYVMDASGAMELVSRSIGPLWLAHSKAGHAVGQMAVFRDHLFVPVGVETLVGRLDRRVKTPVGQSSPWTRWTLGEVARSQAFAVQDPSGTAKLVSGSASSGYLLNLTDTFSPDVMAPAVADADGIEISVGIETRDMDLADGAAVFVKQAIVEYELGGGTMTVSVSTGSRTGPGPTSTWDVLGIAVPNVTSLLPRALAVRKSARRVSFLLYTTGAAGMRLRAIRVLGRRRGRFR